MNKRFEYMGEETKKKSIKRSKT
ncbi:hypothetical protein ACI2OX_20500 [Bacillus sp. N9]